MTNQQTSHSGALRWSGLVRGLLLGLVVLLISAAPAQAVIEEAVFAGGCFWCLEHDLEVLPGVVDAVSGYSGGSKDNPTYRQVTAGGTGHLESVQVRFETDQISYPTLLRAFWRNVDPLDGGGQFCDRGASYRPAIFTSGTRQQEQALASLQAAGRELDQKAAAIRVQIRPLSKFWPAETYHQNYARQNKLKYNYYRWSCGRDQRLNQIWGSKARTSVPWPEQKS
ncbi:peptide-methionine (S)-S-oxide reductase MsrA [Synechococcus sp. CS-602]|uniref:peptide-methionine (S)-S-oxide reductase MsrA n=1 Tax=Synechococcaceae TaxID=1890426 RepID=UPI0008FF1661|nr:MULTISPECIES: peptide-methionine (S)-S-oxide reductase MsrA [Synechococcaceae]MCT4364497.1 peptide-methionine (S)-S-oxide reductase MsrA [Candidatus Regnicoccus frigidus MAG-AL1]APD48510.1 peptide-methionine (S)-S-oxide reductase [Synechococcus sp. SynAce01]MCT0205303.1 peptide-methionine (S)-S-oxide reductase MsrA [Synechococcus sp. CS-602]MCT0246797.1 peptide-methionine (S)-S-oxide reductase MsrA [Synechococcus sp. CS-601]MCT4367900.1 peptide-methionine (S)-S-oxide reductase MsrA [Candida